MVLWVDSYFTIPSAEDAEEASAVLEYLTSQYDFPGATYSKPRPSRTTLDIYGVVDAAEQDRIADLVKAARHARGWKPVELRFYKEEVLHHRGSLTERGRETKLRTITVD